MSGEIVERHQSGVGGFDVEFLDRDELVKLPQAQIGQIPVQSGVPRLLLPDIIHILQTRLAISEQATVVLAEKTESFLKEKIGDQRQHYH